MKQLLPLPVHYKSVLKKVGEFGRWQKWKMVVLLFASFIGGLPLQNTAFTASIPKNFECRPQDCSQPGEDGQAFISQDYDEDYKLRSIVIFQFRDFKSIFKNNEERQAEVNPYVKNYNYNKMCVPRCNGTILYGQTCNKSHIYLLEGMPMNSSIITVTKSLCEKQMGFKGFPKYFSTLIKVTYMAGVFLGGKIFVIIGKKYGGRIALGLAIVTTFFGTGLGSLYWDNEVLLWFYPASRFIVGAGSISSYLLSWLLVMEILRKDTTITESSRITIFALMTNLLSVPFALGEATSGVLALWLDNWVAFQLSITLICGIGTLLLLFIPESPIWLILNGRRVSYLALMNEAALVNGREQTGLEEFLAEKQKTMETPKEEISLWSQELRKVTLIFIFSWTAMNFIYYGTNFAIKELNLIPSSLSLSVITIALAEIPAYIVTALLVDSFGRKPMLLLCMIVGTISSIIALSQVTQGLAFKICSMLTKCTVAGAFTLLQTYTAELYPIALRLEALSVCKSVSAAVAISSPLLSLLPMEQKELGMIILLSIFVILMVTTAILLVYVPDTVGFPLTTDMEDFRFLEQNAKPLHTLDCNGWDPHNRTPIKK